MAFTKITDNLNIIQALDDEPNVDSGMSAAQLKAKFDDAPNKIKTKFNLLIDDLEKSTDGVEGASLIGASALYIGDDSNNNVQAKLEKLQSEHDALKEGGLSDSSVATSKIIDSAVTTAKINNSAVTTDKINDSAITTVKINDSAITTAKVNDGAVTSNKLDTNAKKAENLSATAMSVTDTSEATIQAKLNHLQEQVTETSQGGVADNSISTAKIVDSAITTGKINNSAITTQKIADNAITLAKIDSTFGISLVPSGLISMWSGNTIPNGWCLCDGTNGTPDLRDRFIVGAGSEYNIGNTGGSDTVTLTIEQMPQHRHSYTYLKMGYQGADAGAGCDYVNGTQYGSTDFIGGGQAHENRPPYYALAYIMKA